MTTAVRAYILVSAIAIIAVGISAAAADDAQGRDAVTVVIRGEGDLAAAPHGGGNVYAPHVLREDAGHYRMWYGGQGRDGHDRILYAESDDGGSTWAFKGVALEDPTANHVNDPSVVKVGGVYFMFYTRAPRDVVDEIALATSEDGVRWRPRGTVLSPGDATAPGAWDALLVGRPSVLHEGGVFKMWYDGRKDLPPGAPAAGVPKSPRSTRAVGYATSRDGLRWEKHAANPVFVGHGAGAVDVQCIGRAGYAMVYESRDGTRLGTSPDGVQWTDRGLWIKRSGAPADAHGHVTPFLHVVDGRPAALYFGAAAAPTWDHNAVAVHPISKAEAEALRPSE